jgi:hypothetical protein
MNKDFGESNDEKKVFKTGRSCKSLEKVLLHLLRNDLVINKKVHFKFYILLLETEKTRERG